MDLSDVVRNLGAFTRDAILITEAEPFDEPGPRIVWCNRAFTEATGHALDEIVGKTPRILQGPETCPEARAPARRADELERGDPAPDKWPGSGRHARHVGRRAVADPGMQAA